MWFCKKQVFYINGIASFRNCFDSFYNFDFETMAAIFSADKVLATQRRCYEMLQLVLKLLLQHSQMQMLQMVSSRITTVFKIKQAYPQYYQRTPAGL
jgi:hypothetical protein